MAGIGFIQGKDKIEGFNFKGHWMMRGDYPEHPIYLANLREPVVFADGKVSQNPDEILNGIRARVRLLSNSQTQRPEIPHPEIPIDFSPVPSGAVRLLLSEDSEAFKVLWSGSSCYLVVPADEEFKKLALEYIHSDNYEERMEGAKILSSYPGWDTITFLTQLLSDEGTHEVRYGVSNPNQKVGKIYGVRMAAYQSLLRLGVEFEKPIMEEMIEK